MGYNGINRVMIEVTQKIEDGFIKASKGDWQYKLSCLSPTKRYPHLHEGSTLPKPKTLEDGFRVQPKAKPTVTKRKSWKSRRRARQRAKLN